MPHNAGEPLPVLTTNQRRVLKAYSNIPVWVDVYGNILCTLCNGGASGCSKNCLQSKAMSNLRLDIDFLEKEDSRHGMPITFEEVSSNFYRFCHLPEVSAFTDSKQLYHDFIDFHKIALVLQGLDIWLKSSAKHYAEAGGVHNQSKERLSLKCDRAVTLFLRLDLETLTEEDTIILSNIIECFGMSQIQDHAMYASVQKVMDLISIVNAFKEMKSQQLLFEPPRHSHPIINNNSSDDDSDASAKTKTPLELKVTDDFLLHEVDDILLNELIPTFPDLFDLGQLSPKHDKSVPNQIENHLKPELIDKAPDLSLNSNVQNQSELPSPSAVSTLSPQANMHSSQLQEISSSSISGNNSSSLGMACVTQPKRKKRPLEDDTEQARRCSGRTQTGARCKLTAESVFRLHGRCAEAATPLALGSRYCAFHKSQEKGTPKI